MNLAEFKRDMDDAWHSDDDIPSRLRVFEEAIESILESMQPPASSPIGILEETADEALADAKEMFEREG